jgi:hypothetical protein
MLSDVGIAEDWGNETRCLDWSLDSGGATLRGVGGFLGRIGIDRAGFEEEGEREDWCPAKVLGVLEDLRAESTTIDGAFTIIVLLEEIGTMFD